MKSRSSGSHKVLKGFLIALLVLVILVIIFVGLLLSTYIPRGYRVDWNSDKVLANPHIVHSDTALPEGTYPTLIAAHRAGRTLAPENTIAAFAKCFDNRDEKGYTFSTLEFDLHLTKDEELILLHDDTLDRTSDCTQVYNEHDVYPHDKTLDELRRYNMAYSFEDPQNPGTFPYRNASDQELTNCRICTLEEVLDYVATRTAEGESMNYIIEIKDDSERGKIATDKLYQTMLDYDILDNVIVGTFNQDITTYIDQTYQKRADGRNIIRSAGVSEVLNFYFSCMFNVDLSKKDIGYSVLQIPYKDYVINLGKEAIVEYAHAHGIAVQYWTINDAKDIEHLASIGADTIITDDPELAYQIIDQ